MLSDAVRAGLRRVRDGGQAGGRGDPQGEVRPACAALWETPMVHVDGTLTTCCLDEALENRLGNVLERPLAELWGGPVLHRWRVAQAAGDFAASGPACQRCNWRSAGAAPAAMVEAYLERTGERSALARFRARRGRP